MILNILLVEAHPDDVILGAGGTIAKIKREHPDYIVKLIYFCPCSEDPINVDNIKEHIEMCKLLGIDEIIPNNFPRDSYLENHKQEIRNILWKLREFWQPDIVLCPSFHEFHQDHRAIADCCFTIFRDTSSILCYEVLRSETPDFKPNFFVILSKNDASKKLNVLALMKTQFIVRPHIHKMKLFKSLMIMRGSQVRADWAEAFELIWGRII